MSVKLRCWMRVWRCLLTGTPTAPKPCGSECADGSTCGDWRGLHRVRCYRCMEKWWWQSGPTTTWRVFAKRNATFPRY